MSRPRLGGGRIHQNNSDQIGVLGAKGHISSGANWNIAVRNAIKLNSPIAFSRFSGLFVDI